MYMINMIIVLHLIDVFLLLAEVVSDPDLEYKGEQLTINESTVLQFYCSTMNAFLGCTVEFLRNRKTYDDIRFINNTCHHKDGICQPYRCHCSKDCTTISWNFTAMSNHVNSTFGCGARIQDNGNIYKANSSLQWTGSDFIVLQKSFILLNVGIATTGFPITTVESNQSSAAVVIAVLTSSNVFILTTCILIVCCLQKRQQESAQKEQDKDKKQVGRNEYELHELQVKDSEDYTTCEVKSKQVCTGMVQKHCSYALRFELRKTRKNSIFSLVLVLLCSKSYRNVCDISLNHMLYCGFNINLLVSCFFSSPSPEGQVSFSHHLASVVRRRLSICSSETTWPNLNKLSHNHHLGI
ncbi:uncharacterized protein LOC143059178 isoform X1 [Mytilus galloprovincialis]|uniref:uncharacterized protein LOC143059178 isoform X1 n=1 Tax=Mytilus galloprovincialis TaxID=29158 RepID=UPI003F7C8F0C